MSMPMAFAPQTPPADDLVKNVDLNQFMGDVIERSKRQPVVVDFWSARSSHSKQQGPILEKLVRATKGALALARVDVDRNAEIAMQMGVQSVPAVFGFFQGRPVDGFMGMQPEAQIKSWLDQLLKATGAQPSEADDIASAIKQADTFLAAKDIIAAQSIYGEVLEVEPKHTGAYAGLLRCLIALNDLEAARQMLDAAAPELAKNKLFDAPRTALELAEQAAGAGAGNLVELQAKLDTNSADHQARFDLALAYYAANKKEQAIGELLEIVRRQRNWNEGAARKQLVKLFEAMGPTDPLTLDGRKRLSSILFS